MKHKLKPIDQQVVVITGASSGIGLATAKLAARQGARVVASSRNEADLRKLVQEIRRHGGKAEYVVADVADPQQVQAIADRALAVFGTVDTWVNNAGVSIYGRLNETHLDEKRRLFDVNFWGTVHGCRSAFPILRDRGGAIINVGSTVSDVAIPLQGMYSASKFAVKGYTDAFRTELEHDGLPIAVTLIKPSAINTPYLEHARNDMDTGYDLPPPVYAPEVVARAIVHCASHPRREVMVGAAAKMFSVMEKISPRLTDRYLENVIFNQQRSDERRSGTRGNLFSVPFGREGRTQGDYSGHVSKTSLYTASSLHPVRAILLASAGIGVLGWLISHRRDVTVSRLMSREGLEPQRGRPRREPTRAHLGVDIH